MLKIHSFIKSSVVQMMIELSLSINCYNVIPAISRRLRDTRASRTFNHYLRGKKSAGFDHFLRGRKDFEDEPNVEDGSEDIQLRMIRDSFNHYLRGRRAMRDIRAASFAVNDYLRGKRAGISSFSDALLRGKKMSGMDHYLRGRRGGDLSHFLRGRKSQFDHYLRGRRANDDVADYEYYEEA